jgi:hypothetical protein
MLFIFFGWQGVLHQEFVLEGQTINFEFYSEVTDRTLKILRRVRPGRLNQRAGSCYTIMLLTTTQISTSSFSQRKALLFFVTPLLARFGTCGLVSVPYSEIQP